MNEYDFAGFGDCLAVQAQAALAHQSLRDAGGGLRGVGLAVGQRKGSADPRFWGPRLLPSDIGGWANGAFTPARIVDRFAPPSGRAADRRIGGPRYLTPESWPYQLLYGVPSREISSEPLCTSTIPSVFWLDDRGWSSLVSTQVSFEPVKGSVGSRFR